MSTLRQLTTDAEADLVEWLDEHPETSEPFLCLSVAIRREVEKHLTKFIEEREQPA